MESPVWTPIGSKFSIEQTMIALSARSRITSSSILFPAEHALFDQHFMNRRKIEAALQNLFQFFAVVSDPAARAAHA